MPAPIPPPKQVTADDLAAAAAQRLSVRRGYAASITTSASGAANYGQNSQVAGLSAGSAPTLGTSR